MNPSTCRYCYKKIEDRDQLITATNWFRIRPFHYLCFEEVEKESTTQWNLWRPLNNGGATLTAIILFIFSMWMFFTDTLDALGDALGILALYPLLLRIMSLLFFEVKIPTKLK